MPIYLRITVNSKRAELATGRECEPNRWNSKAGRISGSKEDARSVNAYQSNLQELVFDAHSELTRRHDLITAEKLKVKIDGRMEKQRFILTIIQDHNKRMQALVGTDYAVGTLKRYKVVESHTKAFLKNNLGKDDLNVVEIDFTFITDYDYYLRTIRKMGNNSVVKHLKMFRKIINICLNNSWIEKDPFANFKGKYKKVEKAILSREEMATIANKQFLTERLSQVRDTFLFCCYTGLSYCDVKKLTPSDISTGFDGEKWIFSSRTKTNTSTHIPLLTEAKMILDKYSGNPICVAKDKLLPVATNQKMNEYLREIAVICGINKPITCHVARHTFATTITLQNGVPIETVSKMLGHTNIRTTQIYAKTLDLKVSTDMQALKSKLSAN